MKIKRRDLRLFSVSLAFERIVFQYCFFPVLLAAEYGSVICDGVEMADIPFELQEARVFKLHLRGNGLHRFPDAKLQGTGKSSHLHSSSSVCRPSLVEES